MGKVAVWQCLEPVAPFESKAVKTRPAPSLKAKGKISVLPVLMGELLAGWLGHMMISHLLFSQ